MSAHHLGEGCIGQPDRSASNPLRSTLAYLKREAARRAKSTLAGTTKLRDDELAAVVEVLRREVGMVGPEAAER